MQTTYTAKELKAGDRVWVFERPLTGERLEGTATLIERCNDERVFFNGEAFEQWTVRFNNDGISETYTRRVSPRDIE